MATTKVLDQYGQPYPAAASRPQRTKTFATGLRGALRHGQAGGWASDHIAESEHFTGWNYVAIRALCLQAAQATCNVYDDTEDALTRDRRKTYRAHHREMTWGNRRMKSQSYSEEEGGKPLPLSHPLVKLLRKPNPTQSGASYRYEVIQQLQLTATALIWKVKRLRGDYTVERYVIPTACAMPVPPQHGLPRGGFRILPMTRSMSYDGEALSTGWRHAIGRTIPLEEFIVIRWPHPIFKDDGMSPLSAGSVWIDTSEQVDKTRWNHLRRGIDPSVFISPPDGWDGDEQELRDVQLRLQKEYGGADNAGKAFVVTGEATPVTTTPKNMAYSDAGSQLRDCILALHGTPPVAAGITEAGAYAALYASLKQFSLLTVQPTLDYLADEETEQQACEFGETLVVEYEAKSIDDPTLQEEQLANDLSAKAMTKKEWRALRGRPPFGDERDDELIGEGAQPEMGMMPGMPGQPGMPGMPGASGASEKNDETSTGLPGVKRPSILRMPGKTLIKSERKKYAYAMLRLPSDIAAAVKTFAEIIPDDQLDGKGREDDPHVTVLYGLHDDDPAGVIKSASGFGPIGLSLGDFDVFRTLKQDVLVLKVDSPRLHELHGKLATLEHTSTWSQYRPHVTVAYLKPGAARAYLGHSPFAGKAIEVAELEFSAASGAKKTISLHSRAKTFSIDDESLAGSLAGNRIAHWLDRATQRVIQQYGVAPSTNGNGHHDHEHGAPHMNGHAKSVAVAEAVDPCGAGSPGGKGFQQGNTCAQRQLSNPAPASEQTKERWGPGEEEKFQRWKAWRQVEQEKLYELFRSALAGKGDTYPVEKKTEYMQAVENVVTSMSDEMLRRTITNVDGVSLYFSTKGITQAFAPDLLQDQPGARIGGVWESFRMGGDVAGVLHLDGGIPGHARAKDIYAHEMSHAFDLHPENGNRLDSHSLAWKNAYKAEIDVDGDPLSAYARQDHEEGFAEFGRLYLTSPKQAKQLFPQSYRAWQKLGLIPQQGEKPWERF